VPRPESMSVGWTMQALELLAFQPLSAPQVAAALEVHPRTARRLLNRLRDDGYLSRTDDAHRLYSPTLRVVALAGQIAARNRLVLLAPPFLSSLADRTGARVGLSIPSYGSVLVVVDAEAGGRPQARGVELVPAHCTASGKALLAWRQAWRDSVLSVPLRSFTQRTVTDPGVLRAETEVIRQQGYATEHGEFRARRRAAAAPVFLPDGDPMATISATVTDDARELADPARPVVEHAAALTRRLEDRDG
jgi:IclR family acetate operon transcriptional repressor